MYCNINLYFHNEIYIFFQCEKKKLKVKMGYLPIDRVMELHDGNKNKMQLMKNSLIPVIFILKFSNSQQSKRQILSMGLTNTQC